MRWTKADDTSSVYYRCNNCSFRIHNVAMNCYSCKRKPADEWEPSKIICTACHVLNREQYGDFPCSNADGRQTGKSRHLYKLIAVISISSWSIRWITCFNDMLHGIHRKSFAMIKMLIGHGRVLGKSVYLEFRFSWNFLDSTLISGKTGKWLLSFLLHLF